MQGGKYRCSLLACSIVLLFCSASLAQLKEPSISPIVRADGSVALALNAAQADSVKVVGSLPGAPALMEKRADGIWRIELKSVEPGFYFYSFEVDGVQMIDPSNRYIHLSMRPNTSTLVVPG